MRESLGVIFARQILVREKQIELSEWDFIRFAKNNKQINLFSDSDSDLR